MVDGNRVRVLIAGTQPGGGSSLVLGTTVTNAGSGDSTSPGSQTGDQTGGQTGGGGEEQTAPQPGDGKVRGQWHKAHKGEGEPPPWAKARGHKK